MSERLGLRNPWADTAALGGKMVAALESHKGSENLSCFRKDKLKKKKKKLQIKIKAAIHATLEHLYLKLSYEMMIN